MACPVFISFNDHETGFVHALLPLQSTIQTLNIQQESSQCSEERARDASLARTTHHCVALVKIGIFHIDGVGFIGAGTWRGCKDGLFVKDGKCYE